MNLKKVTLTFLMDMHHHGTPTREEVEDLLFDGTRRKGEKLLTYRVEADTESEDATEKED